MKKVANHLGSQTERLANFKLPYQEQIHRLTKLTQLVQQAWQAILPDTIITTLNVIKDEGSLLIIGTNNHTLANHLTYNRQPLINELHQQNSAFLGVTDIKFRVIAPITPLVTANTLQSNHSVNNVTSRELSDLTKQNIAQLISIVTDDTALQKALKKLLES